MIKKEYVGVNDRQSYVSRSGRDWEINVMDFLNKFFHKDNNSLRVIHGKEIKKDSKLWDELAIPVGEGDNSTKIEGDVDLVVINKNEPDKPLAIISCKTSLHGRFSETLFYSVVWKDIIPEIIVIFATPDKDDKLNQEFGHLNGVLRKNPQKTVFLPNIIWMVST